MNTLLVVGTRAASRQRASAPLGNNGAGLAAACRYLLGARGGRGTAENRRRSRPGGRRLVKRARDSLAGLSRMGLPPCQEMGEGPRGDADQPSTLEAQVGLRSASGSPPW